MQTIIHTPVSDSTILSWLKSYAVENGIYIYLDDSRFSDILDQTISKIKEIQDQCMKGQLPLSGRLMSQSDFEEYMRTRVEIESTRLTYQIKQRLSLP